MKRILMIVVSSLALAGAVYAQGTLFTYEGKLGFNGVPATGSYDMTFSLFTTNVNGVQVGSTVTNPAVAVTNGLFMVGIDFGPGIFSGPPRWLQVAVRTNATGGFTVLSPIQQLLPMPYAIMANGASNVLGALPNGAMSGSYSNPLVLTNTANVLAGNGLSLSNVNAATLNGLAATNLWQTGGNTGTSPTKGNYVGTADNSPLQINVDGVAALRLQPGTSPNVIGGSLSNSVSSGVLGATIAGGGSGSASNVVTGNNGFVGGGAGNSATVLAAVGGGSNNAVGGSYAVVGGGLGNVAHPPNSFIGSGQSNSIQSGATYGVIGGGLGNVVQASGVGANISGGNNNTNNGNYGTIAGGQNNAILGTGFYQPSIGGGYGNVVSNGYSAIGGGINNTVLGYNGTVAGGQNNIADDGNEPTVGGGYFNLALNSYALVPGGYENAADGEYSFAAGDQAQAFGSGSFVWADSQGMTFSSGNNNEFLIRAAGGVGINTSNPGGASFYTLGNRVGGWPTSVGYFENANTSGNSSPALRVLDDSGSPGAGALSVSANISTSVAGLIAEFGNYNDFPAVITNSGVIYAYAFAGNGIGITGVGDVGTLGNGLVTSATLDGVAVNTNLYLTSHPLYLRGDDGIDHKYGLAYCGDGITNFPNTAVQPDGPVLWGYTGGVLGVLSNGASAVLNWNNGQVSVNGNLASSTFFGGGAVGWTEPTTSIQAAPNHGYLINNSSTVTVTLPTTANVSDIVRVSSSGSSGWQVAQNSGQTIYGNFIGTSFSGSWTTASSSAGDWYGVASSADGSRLIAVGTSLSPAVSAAIASTNSGTSWSSNTLPTSAFWTAVASSSNGSNLVAVAGGGSGGSGVRGPVYTSSNGGASWVSNSLIENFWISVASSSDGTHLAACSSQAALGTVVNSVVITTSNGGSSWTTTSVGTNLLSITCSTNGQIIYAADNGATENGGYIYVSSNAGATWQTTGSGLNLWSCIACSANGNTVLAEAEGSGLGYLGISYNGGATWTTPSGSPESPFSSVACSASGQIMFACGVGTYIYYSTNSGATWYQTGSVQNWRSIACSADGSKVVAVYSGNLGGAYTSTPGTQTTTTTGTSGSLTGSSLSAVELQYIGNNGFIQISHQGSITAH